MSDALWNGRGPLTSCPTSDVAQLPVGSVLGERRGSQHSALRDCDSGEEEDRSSRDPKTKVETVVWNTLLTVKEIIGNCGENAMPYFSLQQKYVFSIIFRTRSTSNYSWLTCGLCWLWRIVWWALLYTYTLSIDWYVVWLHRWGHHWGTASSSI